MSEYIRPSTKEEFIKRTLTIIQQYKDLETFMGREFYNVTLLLNCLLALVVMPREAEVNRIFDVDIPNTIKSTIQKSEDSNGIQLKLKFKEYIIGLRNAIVHFGQSDSLTFETIDGEISSILIKGETNNHRHIIHYKFSLENGNQLEEVVKEILVFTYKGKI